MYFLLQDMSYSIDLYIKGDMSTTDSISFLRPDNYSVTKSLTGNLI